MDNQSDKFIRKKVNIKAEAYFDEDTNEQVCVRWFGDENNPFTGCEFFATRRFGTIKVCCFGVQEDLSNETSRGFIKPRHDCPIVIALKEAS